MTASATIIPVTQGSEAWHRARAAGLGSSDAPIITGDAPWGDLQTLWAIKAGLVDEERIDTPRTAWGLLLEDVIAEAYTEREGRKVRRVNQLRAHANLPWMRASLDRMAIGEPSTVVELKTARFPTDAWGPDGSAEIPAHYLVQVMHQVAVIGAAWAHVPVLFSGSDLRIYKIPRDQEMIDALIELETEFWQCVVERTAPAAMLARANRRVIPLGAGEIEADPQLSSLLALGHEARRQSKAAEDASKAIDDTVKQHLEAHLGARGDLVDATYRPNKDSVKVGWELVAKAYRKQLERTTEVLGPGSHDAAVIDELLAVDLDVIESMFTTTTPGARPLRYVPHKEASHDDD